mgnify:CR=1 FL=1
MNRRTNIICIACLALSIGGMIVGSAGIPARSADALKSERAPLQIVHRFSPHGNIAAELVKLINTETSAIHVAAYTLTDPRIIHALTGAQQRGVDVQILLDGKYGVQSSQKAIAELKAAHCTLLIDSEEDAHGGIAHEKAMIFTAQQTAESGSYNYTGRADTVNHEHAVFFYHDELTCEQLLIDWTNHAKHSQIAK